VPKRSDRSCGDRFRACPCLFHTRIEGQHPAATGGTANDCSEIEKSGAAEKEIEGETTEYDDYLGCFIPLCFCKTGKLV